MARFILITGMMGSGKSAVSKILRKKHFTVIDSDSEVKKLYGDPEVFMYLVNVLGKDCLNDSCSQIDLKKLRPLFTTFGVVHQHLMHLLLKKFTGKLLETYKDSDEVIFVEAALIPEINVARKLLGMHDVVLVTSDDETRMKRLRERPGFDDSMEELIHQQSLSNLSDRSIEYVPTHHFWAIENNGSLDDLNTAVIDTLQYLNITHKEKLAVYLRYLREAPNFCHENAWCYSFFNLGGCDNCPFPCKSMDRKYEKLNAAAEREAAHAESKDATMETKTCTLQRKPRTVTVTLIDGTDNMA